MVPVKLLAYSVTCNLPAPGGNRLIEHLLNTPGRVRGGSSQGVTWAPGREQLIVSEGGVRNFDPTRGADVDVTLQGHPLWWEPSAAPLKLAGGPHRFSGFWELRKLLPEPRPLSCYLCRPRRDE